MEEVDASITGFLKFNLITIGLQNGLFKALREKQTLSQLASSTQCDERYLKEWCQALTLGGILTCDPMDSDSMFQVKDDAYTVLEQKRGMFGLVASIGGPVDEVSAGFKTGNPVDYNAFKNFAALIENLMADFYEKQLCDILQSHSDFSEISKNLSKAESRVMDFGCGCGRSAIAMAKGFPAASIIGYDIDAVSIDRANINKGDINNVKFFCQNVFDFKPDSIPEEEKFDLVTFLLCLHDLSYPTKALSMANKILKPGGSVVVLETSACNSFNSSASAEFASVSISVLHCLPCSRPASGPPGEDIGNPFRMDQLASVATAAGFPNMTKIDDPRLTENGFNVFKLSK